MAYTAEQREHAIGLLAASMREWDGDAVPNFMGVREALTEAWPRVPGLGTLHRWWTGLSLEEKGKLRKLHVQAKDAAREAGALTWEPKWDQYAREKLEAVWKEEWGGMSPLDQMKTIKIANEVRAHLSNQARGVDTGQDRVRRHLSAVDKAGLE